MEDITESSMNGSSAFHTEAIMRSRSPSPGPSAANNSNNTNNTSNNNTSNDNTSPPKPTPRIVNGEIMSSECTGSKNKHKARKVEANMINITIRLPSGLRDNVKLGRASCCSQLYLWLSGKGLNDHVIWTQFPKAQIPNNSSSLLQFLGCDRVMLYVEERD